MGLIVTAGVLTVSPATAHAADDNLVAAYGMEEEQGGAVLDMSGNGHDGNVKDPLRVNGKIGKALRFDNAQDLDRVLVIPDAPELSPSSAMTLEAWVQSADDRPDCLIAAKMIDQTDFSAGISMTNSGFRIGGEFQGTYHGPLPAGEWFHLAVVSDGARTRLVVNGNEEFSAPVSGNIDSGSGLLVIGGQGDLTSCFAGIVDEVRLYARALTNEEIARDMVTAIAQDARPSAPADLTADVSTGVAQLSWGAATDDKGVTGYEIHRDTSPDFEPSDRTKVAKVTGLSYTDACVERGWTYYYRVVAVDALPQYGPPSDLVSAKAEDPDCPPTAPKVTVYPRKGWAELRLGGGYDEHGISDLQVHRSTRPDFTPSAETLVARFDRWVSQVYDSVPAAGTFYYRTLVVDTAGQPSEPSPVTKSDISAPPDLQTTIAGAYAMNEGTGKEVADTSGKERHGSIWGPDITWAEGKHGKALAFRGQGAHVHVWPHPATGAGTISAWVKPTVAGLRLPVLSWQLNGGEKTLGILTSLNSSYPTPAAMLDRRLVWTTYAIAEKPLPLGEWSHLAASYDDGTVRLFVNGELVAEGFYTVQFADTGNLKIGTMDYDLQGTVIDEVRSYDAALSPAQIKTIMNTPIG
ncbi:LamG domain-containing protein [Nonomuraea basaltis]|uniref:LamG domain-containing protein n=1 Tax=Nonomuraea basaltis TaxID=2495887 RepID=UPI001485E24C|nr:LamG domain-containing protein [Nonomuraea basaltis]